MSLFDAPRAEVFDGLEETQTVRLRQVHTQVVGGAAFRGHVGVVAVAEVSEVRENSCTANITAGAMSTIRNGDKAEQITKEEAQSIAKSNDFTRTRVTVNF